MYFKIYCEWLRKDISEVTINAADYLIPLCYFDSLTISEKQLVEKTNVTKEQNFVSKIEKWQLLS